MLIANTPIQLACEQDIPALVTLLTECANHMHQQGMSHWLNVYDEASVRQNLLQKTVDYYADCWSQAPRSDFYLTQLAVHPEHQQAGYGRLLLQHCLGLISDRTLHLDAVAHYPQLLEFYRKSGFKQIAEGIGLGDRRYLFEYSHST
jgi:GNAT superfamily N-acetyltransferase